MDQFLFCLTNPDCENLLKEEIKLKYPTLTPSFSAKGFLTFKKQGKPFSKLELQKLHLVYAQVFGLSIKEKQTESHIYCTQQGIPKDWIWNIEEESKGKILEIELLNGSTWYGEKFSKGLPLSFPLPKNTPSRAYLKIIEAHTRLGLPLKRNEYVLELGSAPGGITSYLLNLGMNVEAIDPGEMDPRLVKNPNLRHLKKSIQNIKTDDIENKDQVSWIISDMNIPAIPSLDETLRLAKMLPNLKGIVMTLKTPKPSDLQNIFKKLNRVKLGKRREILQLHAHRKELLFHIEF